MADSKTIDDRIELRAKETTAIADSKTPAIVIDDLHVSYGPLKAIDGISLQIQRGECFGLLGQNGAGKTTLLSCLEGIKKFDKGTILIEGLDVAKAPTKIKELLGVQLQDAALFMDLTAREIIQFYSALYNVFLTRKEALALLERLGLAEKANARVEQLSGGQQQRLTLALSMAHSPSILLLDEPTTGLDPQARRGIWDIIHRWRNQGKTVILTTHYMEEAEVLCQRVGIVDKGKILALGSPQELITTIGNISTILVTIQLSDAEVHELSTHKLVRTLTYDQFQLSIQTSQPQEVLATLEAFGKDGGAPLRDIIIRRPNLEDVFLSLVGCMPTEE